MLTLHATARSPFSRAVRMIIRTSGLPFEETTAVLRDPESPLLAHTPGGRVPALEVDANTCIVETAEIARYLAAESGKALVASSAQGLMLESHALTFVESCVRRFQESMRPEALQNPAVTEMEIARQARIIAFYNAKAEALSADLSDLTSALMVSGLAFLDAYVKDESWRESGAELAEWYQQLEGHSLMGETVDL